MFPPDESDWLTHLPIAGLLYCKWHRKHTAERASQKDHQAFTLLYEYYKQPLGRRLMALVNNRETTEDLYQETFIRVWLRATPEISGYFTQWVYIVARNLAIEYIRRDLRLEFVPLPSEASHIEKMFESGQMQENLYENNVDRLLLLNDAIACMSPQYRVCLILRRHWGLRNSEIAERLDIDVKQSAPM